MLKLLHNCTHLTCIGEGNGNPFQYSCLENPREKAAGGLPSMGSHRVGHDWSNLAAAAATHASKVMLQMLQARLQQYVNCEIPDVQAEFRKGRGTGDQIANIFGSSKKQGNCRKTSTSALLTTPKLWLCGSQQTVENFERDGNTRPPDLPPQKSVCRSRSSS